MSGLVVGGMHRSGTSLVTRMLAAGGWHPGDDLLAAPGEEYFEHADFVALHRAWLAASVPPGDGHLDWGISSGGPPDATHLGSTRETVVSYAARRAEGSDRWMAKDPRATLFLPQWADVDDVHFVLMYRSPWDVVDSALRLGAAVFCDDPALVRRAWVLYNRRLLDMATRERSRCTVVAAEALPSDLEQVWSVLRSTVGVDGPPPRWLLSADRMRVRGRNSPIAELTRELCPECAELLDELDALADVARPADRRDLPPARPLPAPPEPVTYD